MNSCVKREKNQNKDDEEISLLAKKIRAANVEKMAMILGQGLNAQQKPYLNEMSSFGRTAPLNIDDIFDDDFGKFGWVRIGNQPVPYIFRNGERFISVKIYEEKVINKFLSFLNPDLYAKCTQVKSYFMTDTESRLFTEINFKHCDFQFGKVQFTGYDLLVSVADAKEFYKFLENCYSSLLTANVTPEARMGYLLVSSRYVIPYVTRKNNRYVPIFYFESDEVNLREKAKVLKGWDMAYMKFLFLFQGVKDEHYTNLNVCEVINLEYLKKYFEDDIVFEDFWPENLQSIMETKLLMTCKNNRGMRGIWTQKPQKTSQVNATVQKPTSNNRSSNQLLLTSMLTKM